MQANRIILNNEHQYKFVEVCCALFCYPGVIYFWQMLSLTATIEQRARYHNLMSSYRNIDWTYKEKKYLLWLCQLDVNTFETFEVILDKIKNSNEKRADL